MPSSVYPILFLSNATHQWLMGLKVHICYRTRKHSLQIYQTSSPRHVHDQDVPMSSRMRPLDSRPNVRQSLWALRPRLVNTGLTSYREEALKQHGGEMYQYLGNIYNCLAQVLLVKLLFQVGLFSLAEPETSHPALHPRSWWIIMHKML